MKLTLVRLSEGQWVNPDEIAAIVTRDLKPGRVPDALVSLRNGEQVLIPQARAEAVVGTLREYAGRAGQRFATSDGLLAVKA